MRSWQEGMKAGTRLVTRAGACDKSIVVSLTQSRVCLRDLVQASNSRMASSTAMMPWWQNEIPHISQIVEATTSPVLQLSCPKCLPSSMPLRSDCWC